MCRIAEGEKQRVAVEVLPKQTNMLRDRYLTENKQTTNVHLKRTGVIVVLQKSKGREKAQVVTPV